MPCLVGVRFCIVQDNETLNDSAYLLSEAFKSAQGLRHHIELYPSVSYHEAYSSQIDFLVSATEYLADIDH